MRPASPAWIAPATTFSKATPKTEMGARMRSSTSRVPERSADSGISTPCTPAMSMVMDMSPGTITVRNSSATSPSRGRMFPNTSTTRMGWVSVAVSSMGALRDATSRSRRSRARKAVIRAAPVR